VGYNNINVAVAMWCVQLMPCPHPDDCRCGDTPVVLPSMKKRLLWFDEVYGGMVCAALPDAAK
jgi:hypothetical protein